jgi:pimeloyl-ACP methyl ester carboxylesterase
MGPRPAVLGAAALAVVAGYVAARSAMRPAGELSGFRNVEGGRRYRRAYQEVLDEWPVPCRELMVPTRFGETHVLVSGQGDAPPIVLLHATGTSATGWLLNVARLSEQHQVFAVDIMGEAGMSRQTALLQDRWDCVEWLRDVLDSLDLERASLAGWSFGGWTALAFTIAEPGRVKKCVLLAPYASLAPYALTVLLFLKVAPYLPLGPPGRLALRLMAPGYHFDERFADQFALGGRYFKAADPRASVFPRPYGDEELRSLSVPMLLLVGDKESTFDPHQAVDRARQLIPGVETDVLPGIGHLIAMQAANVVNDRMIRFFSG